MVTRTGDQVTQGMRRMLWVGAGLVLVQGSILLAAQDNTSRYFSFPPALRSNPNTTASLQAPSRHPIDADLSNYFSVRDGKIVSLVVIFNQPAGY